MYSDMELNANTELVSQTRSGRTYSLHDNEVNKKRTDVAAHHQSSTFVEKKSQDFPSNEQMLPCRLGLKNAADVDPCENHQANIDHNVPAIDAEDHTEISVSADSPPTTSILMVLPDAALGETSLAALTQDQISRIQLNRNRAIAKLNEKRVIEGSPSSVGIIQNESLSKNYSVSVSPLQRLSFDELDRGSKDFTIRTANTNSLTQRQGLEESYKVTGRHPSNPNAMTEAQRERIEANRLLAMNKLYNH